MAITLVNSPNRFTPSKNPVIWSVSSNNSAINYFMVDLFEATTDTLISTLKIYPTPDNASGAYIDLSMILRSFCKWEFINYNQNLIDTFDKNIFSYKIMLTEKLLSSGSIISGDSYISDDCYVFNSQLDKITFKTYKQNQYVVTEGKQIRFLTTKPDNQIVNDYSNEGLFFLQDNYESEISVKYSFFDSSGLLIDDYIISLDSTEQTDKKLFRINVSPKTLKDNISSISFDNVKYIEVKLIDENDNELSVKRRYNYQSLPCHLTPANIIFINQYGALDTIQLYNPISNLSVTRQTVKNNPYKVSNDEVVDYNGDIFNVIDEIININPKQEIRLSTGILNDNQLKWLSNLLTSEQIILQVFDELYVPVLLNETSYDMINRKYQQEPNVKQFSFNLSDGFTPDFLFINAPTVLPSIESVYADFYNRLA